MFVRAGGIVGPCRNDATAAICLNMFSRSRSCVLSAIMLDRSIVRYSNRLDSCHSNGCNLGYMGPIAPGLVLVEIHDACAITRSSIEK